MPALIIVGAQWGDEGKGKLVDYLTANADYVVRFQGGSNAGHTLVVDGKKTKLSLVPSGILRPQTTCIVAAGVVVDPQTLMDEIESLKKAGIKVSSDRLKIDERAELVLEYHRALDRARDQARGEAKIGTTGRGIGPAYEDRAGRVGVRFGELRQLEILKTKIKSNIEVKNKMLANVYSSDEEVKFEDVWSMIEKTASNLLAYVDDTSLVVHEAAQKHKKIVFEGAQGTLLDTTFGTTPFVTSSSTIAGGVLTGCGIGAKDTGPVLGVAKAYATRVGAGPFPTELHDATGDKIREQGAEFGTVTGRPRRCGWFDAVAMKYAVRLSGIDSLAVTKLDVLAGLPEVKICYRYKLNGKEISNFPSLNADLEKVEPEYVTFEGWDNSILQAKKWYQLPTSARLFLDTLGEIIGCPISIASVGADRESTIFSSNAATIRSFAA